MSKFKDNLDREVKKSKEKISKFTKEVNHNFKESAKKYKEKLKLTPRMKGLIFLVVLGILFLIPGFFDFFKPSLIKEFVEGFGAYSFLVFSAIYLIFLFIPFGSTVTTVAAGLIYGALWGAVITLILTTVLSLVPFFVARKLGKNWVEKKVKEVNIDKYLEKINENSFVILFYLRLIPSLPYEFQNYIAGLTNINVRNYMIATFFGIMPIIFVLTYLGGSLTDVGSPEFWTALSIFLVFLLLPPIVYLIKKKIKKS
ncbi:MAG: TVP38/TMEM64 family protein [Candidatus Woesearchaeota archaeon]